MRGIYSAAGRSSKEDEHYLLKYTGPVSFGLYAIAQEQLRFSPSTVDAMAASRLTTFPSKPRVFVLTDITNEPDDAESFVRYLTYSNQFRTEGIVATTSTWLRNTVAPENLHEIVDAYEKIVNNLNAHVHPESPYPSAQYMRSIIKSGPPVSPSTT